MLDEILAEIRNYFTVSVHSGDFEVIGGRLSPLDFLQNGQYFRIVGSVMNDGVYRYPYSGLTDETFSGEIWALAVPPTLIALAAEHSGMTKKDAERVLNAALDAITVSLIKGEKVQLSGFGTFEIKDREARIGRNPHTLESIDIPATRVPTFKASKALKDNVAK